MREFRRARPWLGTLVEIRVAGLDEAAAIAAIDGAFAEVAEVHRLMSFHAPTSDLSRLHAAPAGTPVGVDSRTHDVVSAALRIAAASDGRFDPCVAAELVDWQMLPRPPGSATPAHDANWRDIELLDGARVRLRRPLWIDLGGIAKGYAVDRALDVLRDAGAAMACVNAGGDLRRFGALPESVELRLVDGGASIAPTLEIGDAAVATSADGGLVRRIDGRWRGAHLDGRTRRAIGPRRSVSVVADACMIADALTKVVLADARVGARLLAEYRASACLYDERRGWRILGDA